jgi:predicted nucleic acid-binding protein
VVKNWISTNPSWIDVQQVKEIDETIQLGAGESEAISLAYEKHADLVLIDDRKARNIALARGLRVAGTINILETASQRKLTDLSVAFQKLQMTNFRIAPNLIAEILKRNS